MKRRFDADGVAVVLDGGAGGWDVFVNGEAIGDVRYWEQRYNLRRVYVTRGWQAFARGVENVGRRTNNGMQSGAYGSMREAVQALVDHTFPQPNVDDLDGPVAQARGI